MDKKWIIIGVVIIILFGGLIWYNQATKSSIDVSAIDVNKIQPATAQNGQIAEHVNGNTSGKITLIEYADYECELCGQSYPQIENVIDTYKDTVTFVFRNLPLTTIHPNALAASAVAEAAGLQGKYWQMYGALYTYQSEWVNLTGNTRTKAFQNYATSVGLDMKKFNTDIASKAISQKIAFDKALAGKLKLTSTPTIFLDGKLVPLDVIQDLAQSNGSKLEAMLNDKLKAAGLPIPAPKAL